MCARFSLYATPKQIATLLDIDVPEVEPRYNIAPTQMLLGAIERNGARELREFHWGLIPSWAKDMSVGNRMINARAEGILDRGSFKNAFLRRRCIIPANGFFEWKHDTVEEEVADDKRREGVPSLFEEFEIERPKTRKRTVKQPYSIGLASGETFAFAGLYEYWRAPDGEKVRSCTIVTTTPNSLVAPLHDRMPVMLHKSDLETWLDCDSENFTGALDLLRPFPAEEMVAIPVSTLVNDPNNETPAVIEPI